MAGNANAWSDEEFAILDDNYAARGTAYVYELLGGKRSIQAIRQKAFKRELVSSVNPAVRASEIYERGECGEDSKLQTRLDLALRLLGPPQPILPTLRWAA